MSEMEVITKAEMIANAAERWRESHFNSHRNVWYYANQSGHPGQQDEAIYNQLLALDPPTEESVRAVIGKRDPAFVSLGCDQCNREVDAVIGLDVPDYHFGGINICRACLEEALRLIGDTSAQGEA